MKLKRKITLGLMVFFVGVLITACGGDESSNSVVNNKFGESSLPAECVNSATLCEKVYKKTFFMAADEELFLDALDYTKTGAITNPDGLPEFEPGDSWPDYAWDWIGATIGGVVNTVTEPLAECASEQAVGTIFGNDPECDLQRSENANFSLSDGARFSRTYRTEVTIGYRNNVIEEMQVRLLTGRDGDNGDIFTFERPSDFKGYYVDGSQHRTRFSGSRLIMDSIVDGKFVTIGQVR